jgi:hypothetical protein
VVSPTTLFREQITIANGYAVGFVISQSANIVLVYVIDSYRPIAGECVVVELAFKGMSAASVHDDEKDSPD